MENYVIGISGTASNGYTITNTITGKVSVPVTKIWVGKALDEVTIRLFADGSEAASHKLTAEENWKYVFEDLPRYDWEDSHEIEYTIIEDDITGYRGRHYRIFFKSGRQCGKRIYSDKYRRENAGENTRDYARENAKKYNEENNEENNQIFLINPENKKRKLSRDWR